MEGSVVGKYVIFGKCRDLHFTTHFRTGLACLETPSSWPVRTWLLLPLLHRILARFVSVSGCISMHNAHRLGQTKRA